MKIYTTIHAFATAIIKPIVTCRAVPIPPQLSGKCRNFAAIMVKTVKTISAEKTLMYDFCISAVVMLADIMHLRGGFENVVNIVV